MKKTGLLLISIIFVITGSFTLAPSDTDTVKREDVLGTWNLSSKSELKTTKDETEEQEILIKKFTLNSDSTVVVHFRDNEGVREERGSWRWKAEMGLARKGAIKISTDIIISVSFTDNQQFMLGLVIRQEKEKITLSGDGLIYEKG
jgi:hypothetical protein